MAIIEFDPEKDARNIELRGISLAEAMYSGSSRCARQRRRNVMPTRKPRTAVDQVSQLKPDWAKVDAPSDADVDAMIVADPDVAPDTSEWPLAGAVILEPVDVKSIRAKLGMSQHEFAKTFGLSVAVLRDWEQRRHAPRGPALTLLRIIEREPAAARRAVGAASRIRPAATERHRGR